MRNASMNRSAAPLVALGLLSACAGPPAGTPPPSACVFAGAPEVVLSGDGGWCWFQDPRVVFHRGKLVAGSVANGGKDPSRKGDIEAIVHDPDAGTIETFELHDRLQPDDHDVPAFLARPDGSLLAMYAKHGGENCFHVRVSEPGDPARWGPEREVVPSPSTRITYQNLFALSAENGRVYAFFRGFDGSMKPSVMVSDDHGGTWSGGQVVIRSPAVRPYVRYASNGRDTIHLFYTEGHPRDFDNSVYHLYYRGGRLHRTDGTPIRSLAGGLLGPDEGTRIFAGDADHVGWPCDAELDAQGRPRVVYSVQVGSGGKPRPEHGHDHRFRFARWDGARWRDAEIAFAGTKLYAGEDDYTGLAALDPDDPDALCISTNVDPVSGAPLVSRADGKPHHELFAGRTRDGGATWAWTPLTRDSAVENLRPIIPPGDGTHRALLWLRGRFSAFTDYDQEIVARIVTHPASPGGRRPPDR